MAKIIIIHGISNQYGGSKKLHSAWYPALCDGLLLAGAKELPAADDCQCVFYGDIFRPIGSLGSNSPSTLNVVSAEDSDAVELLSAIWSAAGQHEASVPRPDEFDDTLVRVPRLAERALAALAKSKYLANYLPLRFFGDLKQVTIYFKDMEIRQKILDRVLDEITSETRLVIGHSLGSVVAYEAVAKKPEAISEFITLGSPLALRNVIFDKLNPAPSDTGQGVWPGVVKNWTNVAATGDIVAAEKTLAPRFGERVDDLLIDSGWDAHASERYLNSVQVGRAVLNGIL